MDVLQDSVNNLQSFLKENGMEMENSNLFGTLKKHSLTRSNSEIEKKLNEFKLKEDDIINLKTNISLKGRLDKKFFVDLSYLLVLYLNDDSYNYDKWQTIFGHYSKTDHQFNRKFLEIFHKITNEMLFISYDNFQRELYLKTASSRRNKNQQTLKKDNIIFVDPITLHHM